MLYIYIFSCGIITKMSFKLTYSALKAEKYAFMKSVTGPDVPKALPVVTRRLRARSVGRGGIWGRRLSTRMRTRLTSTTHPHLHKNTRVCAHT